MPTYNNGYVRLKNDHPISFDNLGNLIDQITGEKGTMMLPGFTVRGISPETKARNYSSAYHPEDALEFFDIMTRPLTRPFSISLLIGAVRNKINGGTYWGSLLGNEENLGIVSKNFNEKHPYLSTAANIGIDIFTPFGIKGINKGILTGNRYYLARLIYKDINHSTLKSKLIPLNIGWGPKLTIPVSHASDTGDMLLFFPKRWDVVNKGANPHGIWFLGKLGYPRTDFTNPGKGEEAAKTRALFANRPVLMQGNLTLEKPMITVGDVPNRSLLSYYADNAGADGLIYNGVYDNGYNNNQVILSFKKMNKTNKVRKNLLGNSSKKGFNYNNLPTEKYTYNNKTGNWNINANNFSVKSKYGYDDKSIVNDFYKLFLAKLKILGKTLDFDGNLITSSDVQVGFPEHIKSYLNLNTVERAIRTMREEGYSEREILLYVDKINEELNKVKIGIYSDKDYKAAVADFGGFYNDNENFISVNKDAYKDNPKFTTDYILKHEGRHLIDYKTSMTDKTHNILNKAYDDDFLEIPKHEDAGSLKDYKYMDREKVTTNADARNTLFKNKNITWVQDKNKYTEKKLSKDMIDFQNLLLKYALPEDIIEAVETSNGYGRKYIEYLRKNNKLTPEKIEQFREAMIKVPSYMLPIIGVPTLFKSINNFQK